MTLYDFSVRVVLAPLLKTVWRIEAMGVRNVPMRGPLIVAANHASYLDPVALGVACPRRISYLAKAELFRIPVLGRYMTAVHAYPVERGVKTSTRAAIKKSVEILREGRAVGIFPQGQRVVEGEGESKAGVALLASLASAPVVPAYISGTKDAMRLHQIKVCFGNPISLPAGRKATRSEIAKFTQDVMAAIRELRESVHAN